MMAVAEMLKKANSSETEKMVDAMKGLTFLSPVGEVTFRSVDHQSTMGAFVGYTALREGKGVMVDWKYADGKDFLPDDDLVRRWRQTE
jgi:branched-chain amino acid transport system substrate-binding protein